MNGLTIRQVGDELGATRQTVYRLLRSGALAGYRIGKAWRVDRDTLQLFKVNGGYNKLRVVNDRTEW